MQLPKAPYAKCEDCPLRDEPHAFGVGPDKPRIIIVGEAPGAQEIKTGIPFIGKSGQLLNKVLKHNNIDRESEVYVTNTVLCRPPGNRTPTANEIKHCKDRLVHEIKEKQPQVVLALGAPASKTVLDSKVGITNLRIGGAKMSPILDGIPVVATFHPAAILRDPSKMPSLNSDINKLHHTTHVGWEPTRTEVIENIDDAKQSIQWQVQHTEDGRISLDIENAPPFDRHNPDLLSIAISHQRGRATTYPLHVVKDGSWLNILDACFAQAQLDWWFQNGKYDIQHLWGAGVKGARVDGDTMLAHYATDERKGTHDLEQLATEFLGAPQYKQQAKLGLEDDESLADLPPDILHDYNGMDADVTLRLSYVLEKAMEEDGVRKVYDELLIPGSAALSAMEYRGFPVDVDMIDNLEERLVHELSDKERVLQKWVKNPRSPKQVKESLALLMDGLELSTTNKDALTDIILKDPESEEAQFCNLLLDYRDGQKTLSTYVRGIRKRMINGRVYSSFNLHGTETGRLSSRNPNLQNITQGMLRTMFTASSPEYVLLNADYSAIELRVAALEIGSPWLMDALRDENRSIHKEVATELFGDNYSERDYRDGKTVTFGIFYDRREFAIAAALRIPISRAKMMITRWKARCPELDIYFANTRDEIKRNGYLRSHFGRLRRFWLITNENALDVFREGYNFKIQSAAGDITLGSLIRLHEAGYVAPVVTVHDSIAFDVPKSELEEQKRHIQEIMEDTPDFDIPTPIEFKEGYRWQ